MTTISQQGFRDCSQTLQVKATIIWPYFLQSLLHLPHIRPQQLIRNYPVCSLIHPPCFIKCSGYVASNEIQLDKYALTNLEMWLCLFSGKLRAFEDSLTGPQPGFKSGACRMLARCLIVVLFYSVCDLYCRREITKIPTVSWITTLSFNRLAERNFWRNWWNSNV